MGSPILPAGRTCTYFFIHLEGWTPRQLAAELDREQFIPGMEISMLWLSPNGLDWNMKAGYYVQEQCTITP